MCPLEMKYTPTPKRGFPEMGGYPLIIHVHSIFHYYKPFVWIHFGDSPFMETPNGFFIIFHAKMATLLLLLRSTNWVIREVNTWLMG